jgi:hypothetical protein
MITGKRLTAIGFLILALVFAFVALRRTMGQIHNSKEKKKAYTAMAPLDQNLINRNAEITLTRSAAPGIYIPRCHHFGPWTEGLRNRD